MSLLAARATSPSLERLGIHEGPLERARQYLGDPLLGPLVPPSELQTVGEILLLLALIVVGFLCGMLLLGG